MAATWQRPATFPRREERAVEDRTEPHALSRIPRAAAVRGRGDVPGPGFVANPPPSPRAGPRRHFPSRICRQAPASRLCGSLATLLALGLSRIPRTTTPRGRGDVPDRRDVANPPFPGCAGAWRHFTQEKCRLGPAWQARRAEATSSAEGLRRPASRRPAHAEKNARRQLCRCVPQLG